MNQGMKIARLKGLLERVQQRAKAERHLAPMPAVPTQAEPAAPTQAEPATQTAGTALRRQPIALPPVVMAPAADLAEADETRPFAKLTAEQLTASAGPRATPAPPPTVRFEDLPEPELRRPTDRPPPPEMDVELPKPPVEEAVAVELPELSAQEPEAIEPEPPASSRRPATPREEDLEELQLEASVLLEKHDTEPPQSGPQLAEVPSALPLSASAEFEVDFSAAHLDRAAAEAPARPSGAQLGQMVELEELPDSAQASIELAPPPAMPAEPVTVSEMEASLPAAQSPGAYSPDLAPTARAPQAEAKPIPKEVFGPEAATSDWDMPEAKESSGVVAAREPEPAAAEKPPVEEEAVVEDKAVVEEKPTTERGAGLAAATEPTVEAVHLAEPTMESVPAEGPSAPAVLRLAGPEPIELEVVAVAVAPRQVAAADVAVFVGAVREFKPATFVQWLEASLELGKK